MESYEQPVNGNVIKHGGKAVYQLGSQYLVLCLLIPCIALARIVCEHVANNIFMSTTAGKSLLNGRKKAKFHLALKKFGESFWKFVYYSCSTCYGILFISWEPFLTNLYESYPNEVSTKIFIYYMVQVAFYTWMTISLVWDVKRKDFLQMATHHVVTLSLMVFSYTTSLVYIGCLILLIHDLADPFLEIAKMFIYTKRQAHANCAFIAFMLLFLFMRLCIFPVYALYPTLFHGTWGLAVDLEMRWLYFFFNGLLLTLQCLNIFWSMLIVKASIAHAKQGSLEDSRSDNESD